MSQSQTVPLRCHNSLAKDMERLEDITRLGYEVVMVMRSNPWRTFTPYNIFMIGRRLELPNKKVWRLAETLASIDSQRPLVPLKKVPHH